MNAKHNVRILTSRDAHKKHPCLFRRCFASNTKCRKTCSFVNDGMIWQWTQRLPLEILWSVQILGPYNYLCQTHPRYHQFVSLIHHTRPQLPLSQESLRWGPWPSISSLALLSAWRQRLVNTHVQKWLGRLCQINIKHHKTSIYKIRKAVCKSKYLRHPSTICTVPVFRQDLIHWRRGHPEVSGWPLSVLQWWQPYDPLIHYFGHT